MAQPEASIESVAAAEAARSPSYRWFVASVASWFGAGGIQSVVYSALLLTVLHETPARIGLAQAALMVPPVFLVLMGGTVADRRDRRALLAALHAAAAALVFALMLAVATDRVSYGLLIAYALAMGSLSAFVIPARDSLLSEVAGRNLMMAVTEANMIQWGAQGLGSLAATAVRWTGFAPALAVQALVLLVGRTALGRVPPAPPARAPAGRVTLHEILAGVREVAGSRVLRPPWLLVMAVGVLFIGPFQVAIPVMVRDVYHGDAQLLGFVFMTFPVGTILGSLALRARGRIDRKGRAQILSLAAGSAALGAVSLGLPFALVVVMLSLWGVAAAVFMASGRTIFQENAPATHRGRVLSVYTLGFMGSAPLGAVLSGALVAAFGPLGACAACAGGMLAVVALASCSGAARV